jgi:hypothetical protein
MSWRRVARAWVGGFLGVFRDAAWLHGERARGYAWILAGGMWAALAYHFVSLVLGHHPGEAPAEPGKQGPSDFLAFWVAGKLALSGHAADAWSLDVMGPREHALATFDPTVRLAFFYPPTFLLLCLPFAALPYMAGFFAFVAAESAALGIVLRRILPDRWGWLPVFAFPGLLLNAATGQNGFISAVCLGVPVLLLERRPWLAGAALGGLAFKPHLALGVPIALLAARRWKAFIAAGAAALGFSGLAWLVLGTGTYRAFLVSMPVVREVLEHHAEDWGKLQSLFTAARLCGASLGAAYAVQAVLTAGVLGVLAVLCWRRPGAGAEGAALAAGCLLCTPHVLDYDLAVTGVPLAWLAHEASLTGWRPWEKSLAGLAFLWPLVGRILTANAHLPLGPVILLGLFWMVWTRGMAAPRPAVGIGGAFARGERIPARDFAAVSRSPSASV